MTCIEKKVLKVKSLIIALIVVMTQRVKTDDSQISNWSV